MCRPFRKASGVRRATASARRRVPCARPPKAAGFPCAVRSARRPVFAAPPYPQGGGLLRAATPQSGRLFVCRPYPQGGRSAASPPPRRQAFRVRSYPQGGRFSLRRRIRKAADSCAQPPPKAAGFPCAVRSARRRGSVVRPPLKRRAFRVPPVSAGRPALAAPAGGAAPPFRPPPAPRRRYTRRFPTCRTGTPTARSRDKASGNACPRCGRRGNIGPVPRRSTSFSPPLGPWGGASLSMPGRNVGNAESG